MDELRFRARIEINGINPYVRVSAARAAKIKSGWRKPMPVLVRVDGKPDTPWRINMMPIGDGGFYLYLHGTVREASGTDVGDHVHVELAFDETYRGGPAAIPSWFERALEQDRRAQRGWRALTPSRQKEVARYLANLKSSEARQRNLQKVLHVLGGGSARFMARDWNSAQTTPRISRTTDAGRRPKRVRAGGGTTTRNKEAT